MLSGGKDDPECSGYPSALDDSASSRTRNMAQYIFSQPTVSCLSMD